MSAPELTDERFDEIVRQLRSARPVAPEPLRERVSATAAQAARARQRAPLWRFSARRAALVLVPACLAVALGAAAVQGIVTAASDDELAAPTAAKQSRLERGGQAFDPTGGPASPAPRSTPRARRARDSGSLQHAAPLRSARGGVVQAVAPLPIARNRLQRYEAAMRIRVEDVETLSRATTRAIRTTRRLGGYVVSVDYDTPSGTRGGAFLAVRVPITRVQDAILSFSALGTILAQDVRIRDVQGGVDLLAKRIARLRRQLADVRRELADPTLGAAQRQRLERVRAGIERSLRRVTRQRSTAIRRAQLATVTLSLTTAEAVKREEAPPGRIERALEDAGGILVKELAWTLYVLVVAAPFLVLLLLALAGGRYATRRADQRLLEAS